ncbi:ABC transporter substrate-binding protein [Klebsiella sp. BIGb0407]|uniref:ABC transporter substrate-binding protein n=1 Tax=Klebsiella sp. BIGb0407 TaxID=2940603 RepID=UPI002167627F|nr:ABC transporter substrate-binding protein [Klebsiella sp. BIGb0407]MCS3432473.1 peptide/nickel transport system substrate-binding protein [Klebsiella sp. BIGb0407]
MKNKNLISKVLLSRRKFLQLASISAVVMASLYLPGTALAEEKNEAERYGKTLIVGQSLEPTLYDPNRQYSYETYRVDKHIYESLVSEDLSVPASQGTPPIIPGLATSWEVNNDATVYTFHLRPNVKFHDGTPFDAEAVKFNVRRFTDPEFEYFDARSKATMAQVYKDLKSITVTDPLTVVYTFNKPFPDFLRFLPQGNWVSGIFSPAALKKWGQDGLADHPTGTGPYKFVLRVRNDRTELVRNDDWWGKKPYMERIIFRPILDGSTGVSALQSGQVDILSRTPTDAVDLLTQAGYKVHDSTEANQVFLGWNFANRYTSQLAVRQAIIKAINREELVKSLLNGHAVASYNILNRSNEAFLPDQKDYLYDPEGAKKLLADAGYKSGEVNFTIITYDQNQPIIEWIQRDLAKVGIKVNVVSQEWITYSSHLANLAEDTGLFTMEWGLLTPQWLNVAYKNYVVSRGKGENVITDVAPLIEQASVTTDSAQALALWHQVNQKFQEQAAFVPLLELNRVFTSAPNVQGFNVPAQNFYDLTQVWLKK